MWVAGARTNEICKGPGLPACRLRPLRGRKVGTKRGALETADEITGPGVEEAMGRRRYQSRGVVIRLVPMTDTYRRITTYNFTAFNLADIYPSPLLKVPCNEIIVFHQKSWDKYRTWKERENNIEWEPQFV